MSTNVSSTVDTEGVAGGHIPQVPTSATNGATVDTTQAIGTTGRAVVNTVNVSGSVDTEGVLGGATTPSQYAPIGSPKVSGTTETTLGTVQLVGLKYRAPLGPVLVASTADTTHTDAPVSSKSATPPVGSSMVVTGGNLDITQLGAAAAGSSLVPVAPVAPTAVAGDRSITVPFTPVADPDPTAPVLGYVIESDTGGHVNVGKNVTSAVFQTVTGGHSYTFRVRARNKNGDGPWSPFSSPGVKALNYDEVRPTGITAANAVNPIYNQDGTVKPGSWGSPTAPGKPTATAVAGTPGSVTIAWAASASGQPSGGYKVSASPSGKTATVAGSVTSTVIAGLTVSEVETFTVTAIGQLQSNTSTASNPYTVV